MLQAGDRVRSRTRPDQILTVVEVLPERGVRCAWVTFTRAKQAIRHQADFHEDSLVRTHDS